MPVTSTSFMKSIGRRLGGCWYKVGWNGMDLGFVEYVGFCV